MPKKYGELANVTVKGFIFYFIFWCFIMCSLAWTGLTVGTCVEVIGGNLANGEVLLYDRLAVAVLVIIGISIPFCIIFALFSVVCFGIGYCVDGLSAALIIKAISRKQCSLFDLYKAVVYSQTPTNLSLLCAVILMGFVEDMAWISLPIGLAKIVSIIILIFGIQNLPAKPFLPENNQAKEEKHQNSPEKEQYWTEVVSQTSATPSKPRVTVGYWRCSCGCENPSYTGTCSCGKSKY